MKKDCFLDFRNELHNNKDLFPIPKLSDSDFEAMIEKAKIEAQKRDLNVGSILFIKKFIISPRLAAALIFAIFIMAIASYINYDSEYITAENTTDIQYVDKNTGIPIENIVQVSSLGGI